MPCFLERRLEETLAQREILEVFFDGQGIAFNDFNRTVIETLRLIDRASKCFDFRKIILLLSERGEFAIRRIENNLLQFVLRRGFLGLFPL